MITYENFAMKLKKKYTDNVDWYLYNLHTPCSLKGQVKLVKEFMNIALSTLPEMENKTLEIAVMNFKKGYLHL